MSEVVQFTPERRVFGEHEFMELDVHELITLPQMRAGLNPELHAIKDSIEQNGLINNIDVARMSHEDLGAYIDFVNDIWGTSVDVADYAEKIGKDGLYSLVAAGHTRTEALRLIDVDEDGGITTIVKVHAITDPLDIIRLQMDENLYSKPKEEQRAIAIVESYYRGVKLGQWADEAAFMRQNGGKFNKRALLEALGFARLPQEARDFVFAHKMSYAAGVSLGLATETIRDYTKFRLVDGTNIVDIDAFRKAYDDRIGLMIAYIGNRKMNGPAAKKYINAEVRRMQAAMSKDQKLFEAGQVPGQESLDDEFVFDDQGATYQKELDLQYAKFYRTLASDPFGTNAATFGLHNRLRGRDTAEAQEAAQLFALSLEKGRRELGSLGIDTAAYLAES